MVRYRYDPFCVKSSIKLTAEVEEAGRGTKIAESTVIPLVFSPIDVKFAEDNSKIFRPGLNYTLKVSHMTSHAHTWYLYRLRHEASSACIDIVTVWTSS